jgi:hypothetical protein
MRDVAPQRVEGFRHWYRLRIGRADGNSHRVR